MIKKLIAWRKNNDGKLFTAGWLVRVAILILVARVAFFNQTRVETHYIEPTPAHDTLVVIEHQIVQLTKYDSIIKTTKHEKIMRIDSLPNDSVKRYITKFINGK